MCRAWLWIHSPQYRRRRRRLISLVDRHAAGVLHGRTGAHLVGHRTDPADAGGDVRRLGEVPAHQQRLEVPGRLEDLEGHVGHRAVAHLDPQRPLALDPSQPFDADVRARPVPWVMAAPPLPRGPGRDPSALRERRPPWATASLEEGGCPGVERAEQPGHVDRRGALGRAAGRPASGVGRVGRPEAAEAAPADRGAQGTATGPGHRPQARRPLGHEQAHGAAPLALLADGVAGDDRAAPGQGGGDHLEQLVAVDRAAVELEVDVDVGGDRRRGLERRDVLGMGVDGGGVVARGGEVPERPGSPRRWRTPRW